MTRVVPKSNSRAYAEFDSTLALGDLVHARWTHSHSAYAAPATIVRLNAKSVRVQLQRAVKAHYGTWIMGHVLTLPRCTGDRWSLNNGVFPYTPGYPENAATCVSCGEDLYSKPRNYLGTTGRGPYCDACTDRLVNLFKED